MTRIIKVMGCLLISLAVILSFSSCGEKTAQDRLSISLTFDNTDSSFDFLLDLQKRFPYVDFSFTNLSLQPDSYGFTSINDSRLYWEQAVANFDVPDIVISSSFNKSLSGLEGSFAELSREAFTANYQTSYLSNSAINGNIYYLPYSVVMEGIIYNETLFAKKGWNVPTTYNEFIQLLKKISSDPEVKPILFRSFSDFSSDLLNLAYLITDGASIDGFNFYQEIVSGSSINATLTHFSETLEYIKLLSDANLFGIETTDGTLPSLMGSGKAAMCIAPSTVLGFLNESEFSSSFKMMPLFSERFPSGVVLQQTIMGIGVSAAAMENEEKAAVIRDIMTYLSSKEGQSNQLSASKGLVSPCYGIMSIDESAQVFSDVKELIESGSVIKNISGISLGSSFSAAMNEYLSNTSAEGADEKLIAAFNAVLADASSKDTKQGRIVTRALSDFSRQDVESLLLLAMQRESGSDISILPAAAEPDEFGRYNDNQSVLTKLYHGDVREEVLRLSIKDTAVIQTYTMTGKQILSFLDYTNGNVFYGVTVDYLLNEDDGTYSVTSAYFSDGAAVEPTGLYKVCVSDYMSIPEGKYESKEKLKQTLEDVLISYCSKQKTINPFSLNTANYIK